MLVAGVLVFIAQLACTPAAAGSSQPSGGFAAVSTSDAARAASWYRDMLGYELLQEGASPDGSVRLLLLGRGDHLLEIVQRDGAEDPPPLPDASYRIGIFKLGFVTCDIEALEAEMRRKGADFSHGLVQPPGNPWRTFAVRDPDGNLVQLFGP